MKNLNESANEYPNKDTKNGATNEGRSRQAQREDRGAADASAAPKVGLLGGGCMAAEEDRKRKAPLMKERKSVRLLLTPKEFEAFEFLGGMEEVRRRVVQLRETEVRYREWVRLEQIEYVYTHATPDGVVFYVGKGRGDRSKDFYDRKPSHILITQKVGRKNVLVEKIACEPGTAKEKEIQLIAFHVAAGSPLVNTMHVK